VTAPDRPIANPLVVLREEFDDWAVLFDPDTGHAYGLNPVSVFIWRRLDGRHTPEDIYQELKAACQDLPADADMHIKEFIEDLCRNGLAGYEYSQT